jgi:hypothetical protein
MFVTEAQNYGEVKIHLDATVDTIISLDDVLCMPRRDLGMDINAAALRPKFVKTLTTLAVSGASHQRPESRKQCYIPYSDVSWWYKHDTSVWETMWTAPGTRQPARTMDPLATQIVFYLLGPNDQFALVQALPEVRPKVSVVKVYEYSAIADSGNGIDLAIALQEWLPAFLSLVSRDSPNSLFRQAQWASVTPQPSKLRTDGNVDSGILMLVDLVHLMSHGLPQSRDADGVDLDSRADCMQLIRTDRMQWTRFLAALLACTVQEPREERSATRAAASAFLESTANVGNHHISLRRGTLRSGVATSKSHTFEFADQSGLQQGPAKRQGSTMSSMRPRKRQAILAPLVLNEVAVDVSGPNVPPPTAEFEPCVKEIINAVMNDARFGNDGLAILQAQLQQILDGRASSHPECWQVVENGILPIMLREFLRHGQLWFTVDESRELFITIADILTLPRRGAGEAEEADWFTLRMIECLSLLCMESGRSDNLYGDPIEPYLCLDSSIQTWAVIAEADFDSSWEAFETAMRPARTVDKQTTQVLLPYNPRDAHWALIVADAATETINLYDPGRPRDKKRKGGCFIDATGHAPNFMRAISRESRSLSFQKAEWSSANIKHADCPRMSDDNKDCGPYILDTIEMIAKSEKPQLIAEDGLSGTEILQQQVRRGRQLRQKYAGWLRDLLEQAAKLNASERVLVDIARRSEPRTKSDSNRSVNTTSGNQVPRSRNALPRQQHQTRQLDLRTEDECRLGCGLQFANEVARYEHQLDCELLTNRNANGQSTYQFLRYDTHEQPEFVQRHRFTLSRLSSQESRDHNAQKLEEAKQDGQSFARLMQEQYSKSVVLRVATCRTRFFPRTSDTMTETDHSVGGKNGTGYEFKATTMLSSAIWAAYLQNIPIDVHAIGEDGLAARRDLLHNFCVRHPEFNYTVQKTPTKQERSDGPARGWVQHEGRIWFSRSSKIIARHLDETDSFHDADLEIYLASLDELQGWKDFASKSKTGKLGRSVIAYDSDAVDYVSCSMMLGNPEDHQLLSHANAACLVKRFSPNDTEGKQSLIQHLRWVHTDSYHCPRCRATLKVFKNTADLDRHIAEATCEAVDTEDLPVMMTKDQRAALTNLIKRDSPRRAEWISKSGTGKARLVFRALFPNHPERDTIDLRYNPFVDPDSSVQAITLTRHKVKCYVSGCKEVRNWNEILVHLDEAHQIKPNNPDVRYLCGYSGCKVKAKTTLKQLYDHHRSHHFQSEWLCKLADCPRAQPGNGLVSRSSLDGHMRHIHKHKGTRLRKSKGKKDGSKGDDGDESDDDGMDNGEGPSTSKAESRGKGKSKARADGKTKGKAKKV